MKILIKLLLFILISNPLVNSQDIYIQQYEYAREQYESGEYFNAVTEFKRLLFFDSLNTYKTNAEYYIGLSYKKGGFYSEAIQHFSLAEMNNNEDPEMSYKIKVEIIKSNILRRTIQNALNGISEIEKMPGPAERKKEINMLRGFAYAFSGRFLTAAGYFKAAGYIDISDNLENADKELYSESKAKILSAIIPGAGQFYTGNYLNGIVSLGLNILTIYLTVNAFTEDRVFDGIVFGNLLWYRFYSGNISNAAKFARENNNEISDKTLLFLQNSVDYRLD